METNRGGKVEMNNKATITSMTEYVKSHSLHQFWDGIMHVENTVWPADFQSSVDVFKSRMKVFPQGFIIAEKEGVIKGFTTSQIVNYDPEIKKTWYEITDHGNLVNTHIPSGDSLYVASVSVAPEFQGQGVGTQLIEAQKDLTKRLGLKRLFLGARIPGYDEYCKKNGDISAEEYAIIKGEKGLSIDPEIRFYNRYGLKQEKVIPEYEPDVPSRNNGIVMVWENPQKI
ncbi:MAG: GNAT family N-acetyltransferase [Candidatus Levybacteria bacterium]|nr:GNAT family N-acetyltransferase [Candidatus Levybacteria bacterium]